MLAQKIRDILTPEMDEEKFDDFREMMDQGSNDAPLWISTNSEYVRMAERYIGEKHGKAESHYEKSVQELGDESPAGEHRLEAFRNAFLAIRAYESVETVPRYGFGNVIGVNEPEVNKKVEDSRELMRRLDEESDLDYEQYLDEKVKRSFGTSINDLIYCEN